MEGSVFRNAAVEMDLPGPAFWKLEFESGRRLLLLYEAGPPLVHKKFVLVARHRREKKYLGLKHSMIQSISVIAV